MSERARDMRATEREDEGGEITVRALRASDLEDVIRIDARAFGRSRPEYYRQKLKAALEDSSVRISLAAEKGGAMVGFLMGSIYYGEYGQAEPTATLEAISVLPGFARQGVGRALWRQFAMNVKGMRIARVQTQVDWSRGALLSFMRSIGFTLAPRICLERNLDFEADE